MKWQPRTRGGHEFEIWKEADGYLWGRVLWKELWCSSAWKLNGYVHNDGYLDPGDLIPAPVVNPDDIPWDALIDEIEFVAMDSSGEWYGYGHEPHLGIRTWKSGVSYWWLTGVKMPTMAPADWKETLMRRPGK